MQGRLQIAGLLALLVAPPAFASSSPPPGVAPMVIIAPTENRSDPTLARGCWVRLFPAPGYTGQDDLTVAGPIELPSLRTPAGNVYWKQKAESIIVGPGAAVELYENGSFNGPSASLKPGARHAQLREELKLMQSVDSLRIRCPK